MPDEKFKLPGSSYEELTKIIKGYGSLTKPASLDEVSKLTALHSTIVSRNAGFLIEIGVLESGAKKAATDYGKALARALDHEMPDEIRDRWRERVEATEFLTQLLTSIRIRKGMTEDTLASHIAYSAGQPKKSGQMTGARTVIDILRAAGLITEADGKILSVPGSAGSSPVTSGQTPPKDEDAPTTETTTAAQPQQVVSGATQAVVALDQAIVRINIDLKVDCKPEDLDSIGPKLRGILDSVSSDQNESES